MDRVDPKYVFVTPDGSYGDASGILIFDASLLTAEEWDDLTGMTDEARYEMVAMRYMSRML